MSQKGCSADYDVHNTVYNGRLLHSVRRAVTCGRSVCSGTTHGGLHRCHAIAQQSALRRILRLRWTMYRAQTCARQAAGTATSSAYRRATTMIWEAVYLCNWAGRSMKTTEYCTYGPWAGRHTHLRLIRTAPIASFVRPCTAVAWLRGAVAVEPIRQRARHI
jgi:hypothetical protein